MNIPSFCIKYKVLKPQPSIAALAKCFTQVQDCQYLLAAAADRSVRKYRGQCGSIQQLLQSAEWRYDVGPQICHCYFLQLLQPVRETRVVEYEVYLQHMQMVLGEMSKLIVQESFYLLLESARGYQQLFSKYKKSAVTPKTIGLNTQGRCIVWIQPELNTFFPPFDGLKTEVDIIVAIIDAVREKSEPHCQAVLNKLVEDTRRKQFSFSAFIDYLSNLASLKKIPVPHDLKYLVNQQKILKDVRNIKIKTETQEVQKNKFPESKTQRYRPIKTETQQNVFAGTQMKRRLKRDHRMSEANMLPGVRVASSFESRKFVTQKDITRKKQSYLSTNMSSFIANSDKKWTVPRNRSKLTDSQREDSNQLHFSKSRQRTVISKCKSSEGRCPSNINVIHARPFDRLIFSEKDAVDNFSRQKSPIAYGHNSQYSDRANSFRQKQPIRNETSKVYKSFVVEFGKRIDQKNKCIGEECEEHESSPNKDKQNDKNDDIVNRSSENLEDNFQVQDLLKANQWTINLDSHQLWVEQKLNTSITLGQEKSTYLQDIKLQKLEMLSRQMAISRLPQDINHPIFSHTVIE